MDPADPYALTEEESQVIDQLTESFRQSEKLQRHIRFLYSKGSIYKVHYGNLLIHRCVPMTEEGKLLTFSIGGKRRAGREFMDYADRTARKAYYDKWGTPEREFGMDFLWWLWAGRNSPIFGRERMATFERRFVLDERAQAEPKNAYYSYYNDPAVCDMLLGEFGLRGPHLEVTDDGVIFRDLIENEDGSFTEIEGSDKLYPANSVIISISQGPQNQIVNTTTGLAANNRGLLIADENGQTSRPGIFASGDVVNGARTVVEAVAYSKRVAEAMHEYIQSNLEAAE